MSNPANVIGGHKANLHNPHTSVESKQHSKEVLANEFGVEQTVSTGDQALGNEAKNPGNVAGGLKAAMKNPNVSEEAKKSAEERLKKNDL